MSPRAEEDHDSAPLQPWCRLLVVTTDPALPSRIAESCGVAIGRPQVSFAHLPFGDLALTTVTCIAEAVSHLAGPTIDVVLLDCRNGAAGPGDLRTLSAILRERPVVVLVDADDAGAPDYAATHAVATEDDLTSDGLWRRLVSAAALRREQHLRELGDIIAYYRGLSSHGVAAPITASVAGLVPIRVGHREAFDRLVDRYSEVLDIYLAQLGHKLDKPKDAMAVLATRLGDLGGGPRDLLDVHLSALDRAIQSADVTRTRTLVIEGRLMALEMMGLLVDYYRTGVRRRVGEGGGSA